MLEFFLRESMVELVKYIISYAEFIMCIWM